MELKVQKPVRKYESLIIFNPDISEAEQKSFFKKQKKILGEFNGDFNHVDTWGKRKLMNPIKKFTMGNYFHTTFEAEADAIAELERNMLIDDKVLRFMHTRFDDRKSIQDHLEGYRDVIKQSVEREKEKEAAIAKKRAKRKPH